MSDDGKTRSRMALGPVRGSGSQMSSVNLQIRLMDKEGGEKREAMEKIQMIKGGVTVPKGFYAAATNAQIKYRDRTDMALIYSETPCRIAGTFTRNVVKAAPVHWDMDRVQSRRPARCIVVNAGIANACTGKEGMSCCLQTAEAAAQALHIAPEEVLIGSTGVIGMQLPVSRLCSGVRRMAETLSDTTEAGTEAARAIMTTDTVKKEFACEFTVSGRNGEPVRASLGGMSKGSGMIHPNMCTMLGYLTTDLAISQELLDRAVHEIVEESFNMISVDGDTSTNDTLLCLANGRAENAEITAENEDYHSFVEALRAVCIALARAMAGDGEGATRLIEVRVIHAATVSEARTLARSVVCSNLTKAAVFGRDANWGRILCALGYAGVSFDPDRVDLYFVRPQTEAERRAGAEPEKLLLFTGGAPAQYSEEAASELLSGSEADILCDMHGERPARRRGAVI